MGRRFVVLPALLDALVGARPVAPDGRPAPEPPALDGGTVRRYRAKREMAGARTADRPRGFDVGRRPGRPAARFASIAVAVSWLALTTCVAPPQQAGSTFPAEAAEHVFALGYRSIAERYVDPVEIGTLAVAGVAGLATLDSDISITRKGEALELWGPYGMVAAFERPDDSDPGAWAKLTVKALDAGSAAVPELSNASMEELYRAVFNGILYELDGFSRYAGAEEAQDHRAVREGFGGIGIRFAVADDAARVTEVLPDTPAARANIKTDDRITDVNGSPLAGLDHHAVERLLRGRVNSRIALTLSRAGDESPLSLTLARALIVPSTVEAHLEGDFAYLHITAFNQRTAEQVSHAFARLQEESDIKGIILDLRDNPGGLLDQAVAVADLFLERGRIISTIGRHPDSTQHFDATRDDIAEGLPMVALINGQSASAAEIVAAALQDQGRAVVIGSTSFGKGSVQNVIQLPNNGELTLTWSRLHAPSGYAIHNLGVMPTVCTSDPKASALQVMNDLSEGIAASEATLARWRAVHDADVDASSELRQICPSRPDMPVADLQWAQHLLGHAELHARALKLSYPAVAAR